MLLKQLLQGVDILDSNISGDVEINAVKLRHDKVEQGDLFICIDGFKHNANSFLKLIGVPFVALTAQKPADPDIKYVQVKDIRAAYSLASQNYFSRPADGIKLIAITGTNGKTSTAHYLASILNYAGVKCGVIGTEGHFVDGEKIGESLTTPDPYEFNELLYRMRARGCEVVVTELSAHAIYLKKLYGITTDYAVLTNISQDHLDFFDDFESYKRTKLDYFIPQNTACALINVDDASCRQLLRDINADPNKYRGMRVQTYGLYNPADNFAVNVRNDIDGAGFVANLCDTLVEVRCGLYGEFNVYNLLAALSIASDLGIDARMLASAAKRIKAVKGRFSVLRNEKGSVIIDFAHTPEGLRNLLSTARTLTKSRLITVFGCGGDRDKGKRRIMGEIASEYSDFIVVTSDNPRGENPEDIMRDIQSGIKIKDVKYIADRAEALRYALAEMDEGDTLAIAGKGNENFLEIRGKKIPFSDFDIVARYGQLK